MLCRAVTALVTNRARSARGLTNPATLFNACRGGCGNKKDEDVNHAMLLVGYDLGKQGAGKDAFWIIRNSWGVQWGEGGYIKVPMLADGTNGYCNM